MGVTAFIYLDTMVWNKLCDDAVDAEELMAALAKNNKQLVLGTEAIYEIAKTFRTNPARGQQLFAYLKTYTDRRILCTRDNPLILDCEAELVLSAASNECDPFFVLRTIATCRRKLTSYRVAHSMSVPSRGSIVA
jgi:hypothetical protein